MINKKIIGSQYETLAAKHLKSCGYKILYRNFRTKFGEIDIIAEDKKENCIVFTEVRYRKNLSFGLPKETINFCKQNRIIKSAMVFIKQNKVKNTNLRFDVISITDNDIEHIKNAFQTSL
jgi:putative endonuclease